MSAQVLGRASRTSSVRSFLPGRYGYVLLAAVVAMLLIVGDGARPMTPDAARIAYLESIIRCPSCADLSIADSETSSATGLRYQVTNDVHHGLTNQAIESQVESEFSGTLLIPTGGDGVAIFSIPVAIIIAGAVTFVVVLRRRSRRAESIDKVADQAIVEAARQARMEGR